MRGYFSWVVLWSIFSFGSFFWWGEQDVYYTMTAPNLNTMNSYFIPAKAIVDPASYPDLNLINYFGDWWNLHIMSSYVGVIFELLFIILIWLCLKFAKRSNFSMTFRLLYDYIWDFFDGILGRVAAWKKTYVIGLFFIILVSNLFWLFNDVLRFFFPRWLRNVTSPTAELEFNVALAIISVWITLYIQYKAVGWFWKFLHEYIPITGKWLIEWKTIGAKIWDILLSLFIGLLDIVWIFAKVLSLSMRLFGNMSSGSILLNVTFIWLGWLFVSLFGFNLVAWLPVIIYIQGTLVAFVQALVFSLLVTISIKLADEWQTVIADEEDYS